MHRTVLFRDTPAKIYAALTNQKHHMQFTGARGRIRS